MQLSIVADVFWQKRGGQKSPRTKPSRQKTPGQNPQTRTPAN